MLASRGRVRQEVEASMLSSPIQNRTGESQKNVALFAGVSFVLAGFEPESEIQLARAIEQNGGVYIAKYDPACTHVIVSRLLLYDDPVCAAARQDRKSVVTELWVADCLDLGVATDVNSVIYKPVNSLDGIPGSKGLFICLTGYQGQARRDVMRMVQMMGAAFTKPLIANRVTHLVCYKFEGEKYSLAKQLGLKLVNHRWLEDCLKQWALLSEDNYLKSGLEEELLEAEAKDSEEEDGISKVPSTLNGDSEGIGTACHGVVNEKFKMSPSADSRINAEVSLPDKASVTKPKHALTQINITRGWDEHEGDDVAMRPNIDDIPDLLEPGDVNKITSSQHVNVGCVEENRSETDTALLKSNGPNEKNAVSNPCEQVACRDCLVKEEILADPVTVSPQEKEEKKQHRKNRRNSGRKVLRKVTEVDTNETYEVGGLENEDTLQGQEVTPELPLATANFLEVCEKKMSIDRQQAENHPMIDHSIAVSSIECPWNSLDKKQCIQRESSNEDCHKCDLMGAGEEPILQRADDDIKGKELKGCPKVSKKKGRCSKRVVSLEDEVKDPGVESMVHEYASDKENAAAIQDHKGRQKGSKQHEKGSNKLVSSENKGKDVAVNSMVIDAEIQKHKGRQRGSKKQAKISKKLVSSTNEAKNVGIEIMGDEDSSDKKNVRIEDCEARPLLGTPSTLIDDSLPGKKSVGVHSNQSKLVRKRSNDMYFAISGQGQEKKLLQFIVKTLGGRLCRDFHKWSHQTTHLVTAGPPRRTEKFFAAAAAGRWILKDDYLKASNDAKAFLNEEEYEWHGSQMNDDGSISFEAPRKWRKLRETTGRHALEGLHIVVYGECIIPSLDTLKRAIRAGGGIVLATSPPYTRFLASKVHFVIVNAGIPKEDSWIQEFLIRGLACVTADFFVDFVCKPSSPLERHVLYDTNCAVREVLACLQAGIQNTGTPNDEIACLECGKTDREDVMLLCGDEKGRGCGIAMHIDCCKPPLQEVPAEDWFCMHCTKPASQHKSSKKRKAQIIL